MDAIKGLAGSQGFYSRLYEHYQGREVTIMLKVTYNVDFDLLYESAWGQAIDVLQEIAEAGKGEDLMDFLEGLYPDEVDWIDLNDLISYDWKWIYKNIGMPSKDEDEEASETSEED